MRQVLTVLLAAMAPATAAVVKLDFGTAKSPVRPGFTQITDATRSSDGTLAGWVEGAKLAARNVPINPEWVYSESRGYSAPPPRYTSDLSQDHVESREAATLQISLPDGQYRVWMLIGHAGGHRSQVWDIKAEALGASVADTFPGDSEIRKAEMVANAADGTLEIHFSTRSRWLVNALIVAPDDQWDAVREETVAPIERDAFLLPAEVLDKKWKHTPHRDDTPLPKFTENQQEAGLVTYHRHYLDCIWPNTVPRRRDLSAPVRAFAARDDYEPMTFTIFPLRDFESVDVEVTDLRTKAGRAISRADIEARYVRYMYVRPNYRVFGTYYRAPDVLMPLEPRPLKKHENLRIWLTVYVDAFARDGVYTGEARVKSDGKVLATVPLKLRVLPFELEKDRSLTYGQYYHHPYRNMTNAPEAFSRRWWRRKAELEHADMAKYGNNTITMGLWGRLDVNGKWHFNYDYLALCLDLYRLHGFYQPIPMHIPTSHLYAKYIKGGMGSHLRLVKMPPPEFFDGLTEMVRVIEEERKRRQWPEFLYYPVDEPSTREASVNFMAGVLKAIKRVPGVRTYVTADPTHEQFEPLRPYIDVWCCQPFNPEREEILADMKTRGVEYWCYPNHVAGENDHTPVAGARMTYGFGFWRSGFRALIPWIYQALISDPWNYLDGTAMDFFNRTGDDAEPIPVAMWEAYREGIDDGRFITTLDRWIERAKKAGLADAVAEAEADRQFVWDSIYVQTKYKYDDLWAPEAFDVYRWILGSQILKLRAELGQ